VKGNRQAKRVRVVAGSESLISSAGASLLVEVGRASGLARGLSAALRPWRAARSRHDPGKVGMDLAVALALGGDCLADLAVVRAQPELFGPVASEATVSRLMDTVAGDVDAAVAAIRAVRAAARAAARGFRSPVGDRGPMIVDLDATIVVAHSEKEGATPTFKRTFGFHPLLTFVDHGAEGTGEPLAGARRWRGATAARCCRPRQGGKAPCWAMERREIRSAATNDTRSGSFPAWMAASNIRVRIA